METKLDRLKVAMKSGDYPTALRIAAAFPRLGDHKERITKGWAAFQNPDFYRQIGHVPEALFNDAIEAIRERYEL